MRVPVLLLCSAFIAHSVNADPLSDTDREALLDNLEKIRESANSTVDARFRLALGAFRNAMRSDDAAKELYMNCMEKVNFSDQMKKAADFREWKRKEDEKLSDTGFRLALRHQLRWLMLTLEAASPKSDRPKLVAEAQGIVDAIFLDAQKLKNQESTLGQAVTSTVFARAYDINDVKVENWSLSPIALEDIYEDMLLPPVRNPARTTELRARWIKRIQQETIVAEYWTKGRHAPGGEREDKKIGTIDSLQTPEYMKFMQETVPDLQWEMEVDLFKNGDESGSAVRMLAHLKKYVTHKSAVKWGEQFQTLLKPAAGAASGKIVIPEESAGPVENP